ncbi:MAG: AAA family ATPase [Candidatus Cloacimonadaceae bacterium]
MFREIKGQDRAIRLLNNAISHNRVSQAYLFYGPEGVGKFTTALYFGMALNCVAKSEKRPCGICASCHKFLEFSHPDLIYVFPTPNIKTTAEGELKEKSIAEYNAYIENRKNTPWEKVYFTGSTEIRKESIELIQKRLEFTQREGNYRVCIVEDADEMNSSTANSFLKTLEEPPEQTVLILSTTRMQSLLPTIISRCQLVFFKPLSYKIIEDMLTSKYLIDKPTAKANARISNGNLEQAIRLTNDTKHASRNLMISFVEAALKDDDMFALNLFSSTKDKFKTELIHDMLAHLALWQNDIALLASGKKDITNSDYQELLNQCLQRLGNDVDKIVDSLNLIDDLHRKLNGNVNLMLILINLHNHLKALYGTLD